MPAEPPTIIVTVTEEPAGFHDGDRSKTRVFAVHLAFDGGRDDMRALLDREWTFSAYTWTSAPPDGASAAPITAAAVPATITPLPAAPLPWAKDRFLHWLTDEVHAFPKASDSTSPPPPSPATVLQGTIAWDAPLPHMLGLTHVVTITWSDGGSLPDKILILPVAGQTAGKEEPSGTISFDDVALDDSTRATIQANAVVLLNNATHLPPPLTDDGFLRSTFDESAFRLLEAIEAKGASLVASLPAFLGLLTTLEGTPDTNLLLRAGCALALDPLRIALLDPDISPPAATGASPRTRREGILLGSLAACVATRLEAIPGNLSENDRSAVCRAFLGNLQDALESPLTNAYECLRDHSDLMRTGAGGKLVEWLPLPTSSPTLSQVKEHLGTVSTFLGSERGIEMLLKNLLRSIATEGLIVASAAAASTHVSEAVGALRQGLERYLDLLDGPVNAADAVRADVGYWTLRQVLDATEQSKTSTVATPAVAPAGAAPNEQNTKPEVIDDALRSWSFLKTRLDLQSNGFEGIDKSVASLCRDQFGDAWTAAVDSLLPADGGSNRKRFQPDSVPQPLPISISSVPHRQGLDDFTSHFNGIGVIIRRDRDPWAHANLAAFHAWTGSGRVEEVNGAPAHEATAASIGIRTFLPVAIDGRREMFLRYHGFPLSSDAYRDTLRDDTDSSLHRPRPFYVCQDVAADAWRKVPRLVYGGSYEWAAFAVTKGGCLPKLLQSSATLPWKPKEDISRVSVEPEVLGKSMYRRRTAVGATTIVDQSLQRQRIGVSYPDVFPLSLDSPRLCLSSTNTTDVKSSPFIDLFRNADGTGQLTAKALDSFKLRLNDVVLSGTASLVAELMVSVSEIVSSGKQEVTLGESATFTMDLPSLEKESTALWLRLRLDTPDKRDERATISFSPPQLTIATNHYTPAAVETPAVVLVGSSQCWSGAFRDPLAAEVILPRTTWLDWEHWCGNRSLDMYGEPRGNGDPYGIADGPLLTASVLRSLDDEINRLLDRLPDPSVSALIAEITLLDRHVAPAAGLKTGKASCVIPSAGIAKDAFSGFRILQSTDDPLTSNDPIKYTTELRKALQRVDQRFRVLIKVESGTDGDMSLTWETTKAPPYLAVRVPEGSIARLTIRPFVPWDRAADGHPAFDRRMSELAVGEATLSLGADETRNKVPGLVFEGASLTIEAMQDTVVDTSHRTDIEEEFRLHHIDVTPIPNVREYRVWFEPRPTLPKETGDPRAIDPIDPWRLFSHCELRTQRWRFSGRPIYGWIRPHDHDRRSDREEHRDATKAGAELPPSPAIELRRGTVASATGASLVPILDFEAELFFDRDDADCELTRVRLTGGRDELTACPWELPSATYFRHAFNFVSRYAGAMKPGFGTPLWPPRQADWSHRAVMLADASRLEVTRPQMRCLVPLTTNPDDTAEPVSAEPDIENRILAPTPPVACILEERPFAVGGLAERMLGEIVTGVGYGFDGAAGADARVMPRDFGKEASRDGRLSAWGWIPAPGSGPSPIRSFVVDTEGPIGLHFEEVTSPAPAWSNCQYLLRPRALGSGNALPEDSFLGVQTRRFLDPAWVFDPQPVGQGPHSVDTPVIVRFPITSLGDAKCGHLARIIVEGRAHDSPLLSFGVDDERCAMTFSVERSYLGANYLPGLLPLCEVPLQHSGAGDRLTHLSLLHMPHGDGSCTLSVAVEAADEDVSGGRAVVPLIVGTARWTVAHVVPLGTSPTAGVAASPPPAIAIEFPDVLGAPPTVNRTAMSHPTYREWARTAKNADFVTVMTEDGAGQPIRVDSLRANVERTKKDDARISFRATGPSADRPASAGSEPNSLWLCGSLANSRMPLFAHRYLVGVFTSSATRGNRAYSSFSHAQFLAERRPRLPESKGGADSITLHEFEVPAKIIVSEAIAKQDAALEPFREATIDVHGTGGDLNPENRVYRLHVRIANSPASMAKQEWSLTIRVPQGTITAQIPRAVHSVYIMWRGEDSPQPTIHCYDFSGTPSTASDPQFDGSNTKNGDRITVTLTAEAGDKAGHEVWADISLLHRTATTSSGFTAAEFDDFTFDWLFSPSDDAGPATRTLASTLAVRVEPQGRLVSSSEPIPIDRD